MTNLTLRPLAYTVLVRWQETGTGTRINRFGRQAAFCGGKAPGAGETLASRLQVSWTHKPIGLDRLRELVDAYASV